MTDQNQIIGIDSLIKYIQDLIQERDSLKAKVIDLQNTKVRLAAREGHYQSELSKTKNALQKLAQAISTTPHTSAVEYEKYHRIEPECPEQ